jgi:drug/metabolite transporter (DMT)-like permease
MTNRLAYVALAVVCFFWGTTYIGIRVSLEGIAPFYLIAIRYVTSGGVLLLGAALAGMKLSRGKELGLTSVCGMICITIGNGALVYAELYIPSGLAALFYTTAPFWMVAVDALLPRGAKPLETTLGGLSVGVLGVAFLVYPAAVHEGFGGRTFPGFLLLQLAAAAFVTGALLQKRVATKAEPLGHRSLATIRRRTGGIRACRFVRESPHHLAMRPVVALVYLITIGSIVGYTAFIYAMAHLPVTVVSIYMFVNPVVAVFLGYLFFREPFGYGAALAMLIIFAGIALVRWSETTGRTSGLWGRPADC